MIIGRLFGFSPISDEKKEVEERWGLIGKRERVCIELFFSVCSQKRRRRWKIGS